MNIRSSKLDVINKVQGDLLLIVEDLISAVMKFSLRCNIYCFIKSSEV